MNIENTRMRIALLTSLDPRNRKSWSGTIYYLSQALQKHCGDVTFIGPIDAPLEMLIGKIMHRSSQFLLKKNFMYYHGQLVAKKYAQIAARRLAGQAFDVIVAPTGAPETAFLQTDIPIVLVEDATFALLRNYYPHFSNLLYSSFKELDTIEALAIKKAKTVIYSSRWGAQSAIEDYYADADKVHVVPFGANLDAIPTREVALSHERSDKCKLLFLGAYWERKGGDIAFETLLKLEEQGVEAELIVCGCTPPEGIVHKHMKVFPFLDKNDEKQRRELEKLLMLANFLLIPTRADCTPIVFCEASAFGLPIITTNTGGIPEIVRNGENGYLLPYAARGDAYATTIAEIYQDEQRYNELVVSSRNSYEERLNWDHWGQTVKDLLIEILNQ